MSEKISLPNANRFETDIKNNYIKLVPSGIPISEYNSKFTSKGVDLGGNSGDFLISNFDDPNSTTGAHEFGHGLGLDHPNGEDFRSPELYEGVPIPGDPPDIMLPRGVAVDAPYTRHPEQGDSEIDSKGKITNPMDPNTRKVSQADIKKLGLDKLKYDPVTGKAQLGSLTNLPH